MLFEKQGDLFKKYIDLFQIIIKVVPKTKWGCSEKKFGLFKKISMVVPKNFQGCSENDNGCSKKFLREYTFENPCSKIDLGCSNNAKWLFRNMDKVVQ